MKFKQMRQLGVNTKKEARKVRMHRMAELQALREKQEDERLVVVVGSNETRLRSLPDSRAGMYSAATHVEAGEDSHSPRWVSRKRAAELDDRVMLFVGGREVPMGGDAQ